MNKPKTMTYISVMILMITVLLIGCQQDTSGSSQSGGSDSDPKVGVWESWQSIEITEGKGSSAIKVSVSTPWNTASPQNAFGADIAKDIKRADGWELIFNTCAKDGYGSGRNYLIFYNKLLGIMRVFYYCDMEITGTGNEHFWQIIMGKNQNRTSYYGQLPLAVSYSDSINANISGGTFDTRDIFNQLVTNYQRGNNKTLAYKTWNCFDLDMSAYSDTNFSDADDEITFQLYATKTSNVTLESTLSAKLSDPSADKTNTPSSSGKGFFDVISSLKDLGTKIWKVGKAAFGLYNGDNIMDNINTIAGSAPGLVSDVKGFINMFSGEKTGGQTKSSSCGIMSMNLNGTIDSKGYIAENGIATDIPVFTISSANIPSDARFGEGIWNLKDTPRILILENLLYSTGTINNSKYCIPMSMLDPDSITLLLRDDIKQAAQNISLETVWGFMEDAASYAEYRTALGLAADRLVYADIGPSTEGSSLHLIQEYADVSHDRILDGALTGDWGKDAGSMVTYELVQQYTDMQRADLVEEVFEYKNLYYAPCLKMKTEDGRKSFIAFPQNLQYKAQKENSFRYEKLIVLVRLQFELNGNKHVYSRRYLPDIVVYYPTQGADELVYSMLDTRKKRKAADWKVDGVSYPVIRDELENLYNLYYDTKTKNVGYQYEIKEWTPNEQYRD